MCSHLESVTDVKYMNEHLLITGWGWWARWEWVTCKPNGSDKWGGAVTDRQDKMHPASKIINYRRAQNCTLQSPHNLPSPISAVQSHYTQLYSSNDSTKDKTAADCGVQLHKVRSFGQWAAATCAAPPSVSTPLRIVNRWPCSFKWRYINVQTF